MSKLFKDYGIGVGLRPAHYSQFMEQKPKSVNWVEVITENFLPWQEEKNQNNSKAYNNLLKIRREVPMALHGVSLSLGSADELNLDYLKKLKDLKNTIEPIWISDHLCWSGVDGENLHDLYPLPYNEETLDFVAKKIIKTQDFLNDRIIIENVSSYIEYQTSEITEWEFIAELAKRTECGLLLDVNNVYVSAINHNFDAKTYIDHMPKDLVAQIHLAGHTENNGHLIDTHSTPVCKQVWELFKYTLQKLGRASSMIERDDNIPKWIELETELQIAQRIYDQTITT